MLKQMASPVKKKIRYKFNADLLAIVIKQLEYEIEKFAKYYKPEDGKAFCQASSWQMYYCNGYLTLDASKRCPKEFYYYLDIAFFNAVRYSRINYRKNNEKKAENKGI